MDRERRAMSNEQCAMRDCEASIRLATLTNYRRLSSLAAASQSPRAPGTIRDSRGSPLINGRDFTAWRGLIRVGRVDGPDDGPWGKLPIYMYRKSRKKKETFDGVPDLMRAEGHRLKDGACEVSAGLATNLAMAPFFPADYPFDSHRGRLLQAAVDLRGNGP